MLKVVNWNQNTCPLICSTAYAVFTVNNKHATPQYTLGISIRSCSLQRMDEIEILPSNNPVSENLYSIVFFLLNASSACQPFVDQCTRNHALWGNEQRE